MNELALFAGAGGGILGGQLLGWRTVCAVEINAYAASVLCARQNDGLLPPFPVWDDIRTFDGNPWRGIVDVVSGGFPCQDISAAGKGDGINGERSGLWGEMARIVGGVRPEVVFVENSPILTSRGLDRVLGDLAALGYDAEWGVLGAADVGAPHQRDRIWIVAYATEQHRCGYEPGRSREIMANTERPEWWPQGAGGCGDKGRGDSNGLQERQEDASRIGTSCAVVADPNGMWELQQERGEREQRGRPGNSSKTIHDANCPDCNEVWRPAQWQGGYPGQPNSRPGGVGTDFYWPIEPDVGRVVNGLAARVDRLTALGNGQVPACAAEAFRRLIKKLEHGR